ncbi:MAG TPA: phospholipase D-like domain-containing protein [Rhizomicrobium sp.]|jgi:cardiolipin synthase|nr:phospholipase D-like domain-containing protein [Rhizomicrobium sp.]
MRKLIVAAVCTLVAACAAVPKVNDTPPPEPARIVGARGPLTLAQSRALLDRIAPEPGDAGILKRHTAIEEAVAETPLVAGNATRLLIDGSETFAAMFAAIRGARASINLEYYILEDIESGGLRLSDLLIAKRQQRVAVNILYDSYGSKATPPDFFHRLQDAGVRIVEFNPLNPVTFNFRDHRKILVVDGEKAIVGGINLSMSYQSSFGPGSGGAGGKGAPYWRDTDLEIDGPVVAQLQALFLEHWDQQKGPPLDRAQYFPTVSPQGREVARIIGSTPDKEVPRFYVTLLSAIRNAEKNVWLSAAYFVPTSQEEQDLVAAAKRGIDVRLLLPGNSDSKMALAVGRSHYGILLEAGVKIYEVQNEVLHSKTASIDGVWTAVGSSNFDPRSVVFNDEVDAIVLGSATAGAFEHMFQRDLAQAKQIDLEEWRRRPLDQRLLELFEVTSFLWRNWL